MGGGREGSRGGGTKGDMQERGRGGRNKKRGRRIEEERGRKPEKRGKSGQEGEGGGVV